MFFIILAFRVCIQTVVTALYLLAFLQDAIQRTVNVMLLLRRVIKQTLNVALFILHNFACLLSVDLDIFLLRLS